MRLRDELRLGAIYCASIAGVPQCFRERHPDRSEAKWRDLVSSAVFPRLSNTRAFSTRDEKRRSLEMTVISLGIASLELLNSALGGCKLLIVVPDFSANDEEHSP